MFAHVVVIVLAPLGVCAMAQVSDSKRARLTRVGNLRRRLSHMSASAFASTLKELHANPVDPVSRQDVAKARDIVLNERTPYGKIVKELEIERKTRSMILFWSAALLRSCILYPSTALDGRI